MGLRRILRGVWPIGTGVMIATALALSPWGGPAAEPADAIGKLPTNQWVKLPADASEGAGYSYSGLAYEPGRGQVLHWGGVLYAPKVTGRNDMRAFDIAPGKWTSDYPSTAKDVGITGGVAFTYTGNGEMRSDGLPKPGTIVFGVCYDSKRKQLVYTMPGLMAAYNPATKKWTDLKAMTVLNGKELPGAPPFYGVGTCYDPVNDEIVLFPHFVAKNTDLRDATGEVTGHLGTFRYRFADNTWKRVSDTMGSEEVKAQRKQLIGALAEVSAAADAIWRLRREPKSAGSPEVAKRLLKAAAEADALALQTPALKHAAEAVSTGKLDDAHKACSAALWSMRDWLNGKFQVEPEARCAAPLVYDPKNQCIVMFGGHNGLVRTDLDDPLARTKFSLGLDDTWVYDCRTRQWRQLDCKQRPPRTRLPMLAYDPASGLIVLVTLPRPATQKAAPKATIWTLDVAKATWSKRGEQDWPGPVFGHPHTGGWTPDQMMALDEKARLLLIVQPDGAQRTQTTYALKLDLAKLPVQPAPAAEPAPPIQVHAVAADDPAWIEKLKRLPANTWIAAKPKPEPQSRDWGNLSIDPVRGWVVYFGGGHSSYQVSDVAVYNVGANRWSSSVGTSNDFIPPVNWEGITIGFRGSMRAGHMRNRYQSFDGRMYVAVGLSYNPPEFLDSSYTRYCDIGRGGVWREDKIAAIEKPGSYTPVAEDQARTYRNVQMVDPGGRILDVHQVPASYYDWRIVKTYFRSYDINANRLTIREVPPPFPMRNREGRPFCYMPDRDQVFWCEFNLDEKKEPRFKRTWVYDVKANKFIDLQPKRALPGVPLVVEYVQPAKCVLGIFRIDGKDEQWVYSLEKNAWAPLEIKTDTGKIVFQSPYGQMVWVQKFGVLMNYHPRSGTSLMRPDFAAIQWDR